MWSIPMVLSQNGTIYHNILWCLCTLNLKWERAGSLYSYCCLCREVEWPLPSWVIRRNFALSEVPPPTGTGIPEPFMLIRPPEEGVASLLSLTLLSIPTSGTPPSAPRIDKLSRVGTRSFPARALRLTSVQKKTLYQAKALESSEIASSKFQILRNKEILVKFYQYMRVTRRNVW